MSVSASQARRHRRMAARNRKPLTPIERGKLRAAILKRVLPGDTLDKIAGRLHQPKARIVEAVGHDIEAVDALLGEGESAAGILERSATKGLSWTPAVRGSRAPPSPSVTRPSATRARERLQQDEANAHGRRREPSRRRRPSGYLATREMVERPSTGRLITRPLTAGSRSGRMG